MENNESVVEHTYNTNKTDIKKHCPVCKAKKNIKKVYEKSYYSLELIDLFHI